MQQWEYLTGYFDVENGIYNEGEWITLSYLGDAGWELIGTVEKCPDEKPCVIFKRPKTEKGDN